MRTRTYRVPESFDTQLDGRDVCVEFTRVTTYSYDPTYGADADGNRGVPMDFIDDDHTEAITILSWEENGAREVVRAIQELPLEREAQLHAEIEDYLVHVGPTPPEDEYDGPDTREEVRGE
jgi:hypothetical protein